MFLGLAPGLLLAAGCGLLDGDKDRAEKARTPLSEVVDVEALHASRTTNVPNGKAINGQLQAIAMNDLVGYRFGLEQDGIQFHFTDPSLKDGTEFLRLLHRRLCLMMACISQAQWMAWDSQGKDDHVPDGRFTREQANELAGAEVTGFGSSVEKLRELVEKLSP